MDGALAAGFQIILVPYSTVASCISVCDEFYG